MPMPQEPKIGKASELIISINEDMNALADIVGKSQLPPEEKKQFGQLLAGFADFSELLSQPIGQQPQQAAPQMGNVPTETAGKPAMPMPNMGRM